MAKGDLAGVLMERDAADGTWTDVTQHASQTYQDGLGHNVGEATDWGVWGVLNNRQVLACGGVQEGAAAGMIWLWLPDENRLVQFETGSIRRPMWGAWGQFESEAVLATGGEDGSVRFWDPRSLTERRRISISDQGMKLFWGAWGQSGEPLATGGDTTLRVQPIDLRALAGSKVASLALRNLPGDETHWGAWGHIDGVATLAFGDGTDRVQFLDTNPDHLFSIQLSGSPRRKAPGEQWGSWGGAGGKQILTVGDSDGNVWFCDPVSRSAQLARLGRPVRWGSWTQLDGGPVLAVGDHEGTVWLYDFVWERAVPRVPQYKSDAGGAVDLLGRRNDAAALADLITARSARPPLAVGVFGQWGDGKSMFLEMLQEQVGDRARNAGVNDPIAHGQVRQVRFNAWHYAEADLWASLVAELFAQLSDGPGTDPAQEQRQRSRLASELVQARGLREQLAAAQARLDDLRAASAGKAADWTTLTPSAQVRLRATLGESAEKRYEEAIATAATARPAWRSWTELARALPRSTWLTIAVALPGAAALAVWGPGLLRWAATVPVVAAIVAFAGAARPVLERMKAARERGSSIWQQLQGVREEQQRRLQTAEAVAVAEVEELRKRLQSMTSAGQLAGLVQERSGSASYRERLGLMTEIRQDFERMAELLGPHETDRPDVPLRDAAGDELPAIDRIVIYIDDLDRCPPARVIDVLEAIHLLLAVHLFVVVVAVDPRWLLRSLTTHYRELFAGAPGSAAAAGGDAGEDELWASTPAQYLDKIFQIVLTLPPMQQAGYQRMIDDLVGLRSGSEPEPDPVTAPTADEQAEVIFSSAADDAPELIVLPDPLSVALDGPIVERVDPLALTEDEYALINLLGPPLVNGPRSVKRLANSYGLLVATSPPGRQDLQPVTDPVYGPTYPYRAGMVLLGAVIGFPMLGPSFFPDLHHKAKSNPDLAWSTYLKEMRPGRELPGNRIEPEMSAARAQQWAAFLDALEAVGERAAEADLPLPQGLAFWGRWVVPVGRLSFPTGGAVTRLGS